MTTQNYSRHLLNIHYRKRLTAVIFLILPFCTLYAQKKNDLIQFYGRLYNELIEPLPYAHVLVLNNSRGTITDPNGKFSFVVQKNDTIMFSSLGYKRKIMVIPDTLSEPYLHRDIFLETDTFMIQEVEVYPWKNYEEFKQAFVNLKLPDNDAERARKNIALIKTQIILDDNPDPGANFQYVLQQQYDESFRQGRYPSYQLFNVFAWEKFFEALKRGDFRQDKNK
jgi:hypothetical protein